jgi:hypothetical protein
MIANRKELYFAVFDHSFTLAFLFVLRHYLFKISRW